MKITKNSCWLPPHMKKFLLVMKITAFLLFISIMQVSASGFAQKITFTQKDVTLEKLFREIKKQTGYTVFYSDKQIDDTKKLDVDFKDTPLKTVLNQTLDKQALSFSIEEHAIYVKRQEKGFLERVIDRFNAIDVHGRVVDGEGQPLPGASVKVKGVNKVTSANGKGEFYLEGVDEHAVLVVSFIGYVTKEVAAAATTMGDIRLEIATADLDEVTINKGYYTTTKELNTGNVSAISSEEISRQPVGDPLMALEGRIPGLAVSQVSGIPGSEVKVQLRGQNSIANGNAPLYIIDGVPFSSQSLYTGLAVGALAVENLSPFSSLRTSDIERIEVLKDADATAIYGSRGANGVILITTKKGQMGNTRINVNVYQGVGRVSNTMDLLNTHEYLNMRRQAFKNDGTSPTDYDYDINGVWDTTRNTNWQDVMIGGTSHLTDAQVNLSGGSEQTQFLIGGGYRRETTVFPSDYRDQKGSAHLNLNHKNQNEKFHLNLSLNYTNDNNRLPLQDFTSNILLAPDAPAVYNLDGSLNWQNSTWDNPLFPLVQSNTSKTDNLNSSIILDYNVLKDLKLSLIAGYDDIKLETVNLQPLTGNNPAYGLYPNSRRNNFGNNRNKSWIIEPTISYNFTIGKGKVETLFGSTLQQSEQYGLSQLAYGFSSDALIENPAAATTLMTASIIGSKYLYNALYARIGYNYLDKYVLNLTGRRDGSSRFGPGKQFGNFGAVGMAWIFTNESFIKNLLPILSFGKLRGSYGLTGNDQLGDYKYLSTYSPDSYSYQGVAGLAPTSLTNRDYGWETVRKVEASIDLGFFRDRIMFNMSWYNHRTGNQLVGYNLPIITGFPSVTANLPAVIQNRGLEFEFNTRNIEKKNFSWSTTANLSIPKNKLVSYPNITASGYANIYAVGQPLSVVFLYHYLGVDPNKGIYTFEDLNKDAAITYASDRKASFVGQNFYGGIGNDLKYKQFELNVFLQFVKQKGFDWRGVASPGIFAGSATNQKSSIQEEVNHRTAQSNTSSFGSEAQKAYSLFMSSTGPVVNTSFIRLKNVSLSWSVPTGKVSSRIGSPRIYVQAQNLFTFTKYKGLDPETTTPNSPYSIHLPSLRVITAGIELNF